MPRLVTTVHLTDDGLSIFGDSLKDAGFDAGDTVEVRSFEESMTVKTLSGQQLEILKLLPESEEGGVTAAEVGQLRVRSGFGGSSYPIGEDAARSSLNRLIARGLVTRDGRPAKHWRTALGNQALEG